MTTRKTLDVFITHAWRYHEDWTRLSELLDASHGAFVRNFSVPWHDPALDPATELGARLIHENLEAQIAPVHGVLLLAGVYGVKSARRWLELELELARRAGKTVLALPPLGRDDVGEEVARLADAVVPWNAAAIVSSLEKHVAL